MKVLAVGSDPEFFIQDSAGNIIPSRGIIPGNKKKPRPLVWGAVHSDNVASVSYTNMTLPTNREV
jgi:hypothetical protein